MQNKRLKERCCTIFAVVLILLLAPFLVGFVAVAEDGSGMDSDQGDLLVELFPINHLLPNHVFACRTFAVPVSLPPGLLFHPPA